MITTLDISGPAGILEAKLDAPDSAPRAVAVLAHPHPQYGGTLQTKAVYEAAKALARIGVAVVRFNFRGVGRSQGVFDDGAGERADFEAAVACAVERFPGVPVWAAGVSFGAWIALTTGVDDPRVSVLLGIATPIDLYDFGSLKSSSKPVFLIHGEADEIVSIKAVRRFYGELPEPRELAVIEDADHLFDGKTSLVGETIEDLLGDFEAIQRNG
jgi:alpha/beta superfamily hydrolase